MYIVVFSSPGQKTILVFDPVHEKGREIFR